MALVEMPTDSRVARVQFTLEPLMAYAPTRGGRTYALEIGRSRWVARYETSAMLGPEAGAFEAWLDAQKAGIDTFYGFDPFRRYPSAYPAGTGWGTPVLTGVTVATRTLTTAGWAANATIKAGDLVSWFDGTSQMLHRVVADVTAGGDGAASLVVLPRPATPSASYPIAMRTTKPAAEMRVVSVSPSEEAVGQGRRFTFDAISLRRA